MRIVFEVVSVSGTVKWMEDGKRRQKTKKFMQTINPYNTNEYGMPKTRAEIMTELMNERDAWVEKNTNRN